MAPNFNPNSYGENGFLNLNSSGNYYGNSMVSSGEDHISFTTFGEAPHSMSSSLDIQTNNRQWSFQDVDDLQSMAFGYAQNSWWRGLNGEETVHEDTMDLPVLNWMVLCSCIFWSICTFRNHNKLMFIQYLKP